VVALKRSPAGFEGVNRLQLNAAETEFVLIIPPRRRHQLLSDHLSVGSVSPGVVTSVSTWTATCQWGRIRHGSCHVLRQICRILRSLQHSTLTTLISNFNISKLDYCNVVGILADLPRCNIDRLQSHQSCRRSCIVGAQCHDHITTLLSDIHWLRCLSVQGCRPIYLERSNRRTPQWTEQTVVSTRRGYCGQAAGDTVTVE